MNNDERMLSTLDRIARELDEQDQMLNKFRAELSLLDEGALLQLPEGALAELDEAFEPPFTPEPIAHAVIYRA